LSRTLASEHEVKYGDGLRLAVDVSGDPDGVPVVHFHGMPGSRSGPRPRSSVLYRQGIKLISYDRPGYGDSTRKAGRSVADSAKDVAAIAEYFKLDRLAVAGRSGGGPHALAAIALLPDLVLCAAVFVSLAPADAPGLDWFNGMTDTNVMEYLIAGDDDPRLAERLRLRADQAVRDPDTLVGQLRDDMTGPDRRAVNDVTMLRLLREAYRQAFRSGSDGWADDVIALRRPWGFHVGQITRPVRLWHGENDNFAPVSHARWLERKIPSAQMYVQAGTAHFGAVEALTEAFPWVIQKLAAAPEDAEDGVSTTTAPVRGADSILSRDVDRSSGGGNPPSAEQSPTDGRHRERATAPALLS
jgi:pimeloyl-ACP methyl ester carboxylesterase